MPARPLHLSLALLAVAAGCMTTETRRELDRVTRVVGSAQGHPGAHHAGPGASDATREEQALSREARLDLILRVALAHNPDPQEAEERARAALHRVTATARLPDLELKQEVSGVPLARPYGLDQAQMILFGVRQTFPPPGSIEARARTALAEARQALAGKESRVETLVTRVRRAYYEYYRLDHERRVVAEHLELSSRLAELARLGYQSGRSSQQDVLRLVVEQTRLKIDATLLDQQHWASQALLNTLMGRSPDAALGPTPDLRPTRIDARLEALERDLTARLPELRSAWHGVARSEAALAVTEAAVRWPSFMVGADYWLMPMGETQHGYGVMVAINLPWLNPRRREEVREAEHTLAADQRALESTRNIARYQLREAFLRYQAEQKTYLVVDRDLLTQAQLSFDTARAAYAAGQGDAAALIDALRSLLEVRLERVRALTRLEVALADLGRAAGDARSWALGQPTKRGDHG
jgi:outer membrane protein TolC